MKANTMRQKTIYHVGITVFLTAIVSIMFLSDATAEVAARGNGNDAALAKAQYLLRQISMEKDALQAENAQIKDEVEKRDKKIQVLSKKIKNTNKSLSSSRNTLGKYQEVVTAQRTRMVEMRDKFQKLVDKYKELVAALRLVEEERASIQKAKQAGLRMLDGCADKNQKLSQINTELLKKYRDKGVWDAIMQKEPVTQLKQVEIENYIEDMQYRIERLKVANGNPMLMNK